MAERYSRAGRLGGRAWRSGLTVGLGVTHFAGLAVGLDGLAWRYMFLWPGGEVGGFAGVFSGTLCAGWAWGACRRVRVMSSLWLDELCLC